MSGGIAAPIRGVILAGGSASRLGGMAKGLEEVGGRRILDRVTDALRTALGAEPLLIANDPGAGLWDRALEVVADRHPGTGPLGGIATGLEAAGTDVLCVAWDMPFLEPDLLRAIAAGLAGADACLAESTGPRGLEPLAAGYARSALAPITAAIGRGDLAAVGFHGAARIAKLPLTEVRRFGDPARLFFNVNTAEDLARARAWAPSPSPGPSS